MILTRARRPRPALAVRPAGEVGTLWLPPVGVASSRLSRPTLALMQQILIAMGYTDNGRMRADGLPGAITTRAVTAFQRDMQPARLAAETTPLGERARAFAAATSTLAVDGDLGPRTQQWLRWLATPGADGGGGQAATHASVPAVGVTPERLSQTGGTYSAPPQTVETARESRVANGSALARAYGALSPVGLRLAGRRTVLLAGLDPTRGARITGDGRDITAGLPEDGTRPRWITLGGVPVWVFGVPEGLRSIRVQPVGGAETSIALSPPPAGASPGERIAAVAMPGSTPPNAAPPPTETAPPAETAPPNAAPPPGVATASMGRSLVIAGVLAALVGGALSLARSPAKSPTRRSRAGR